jgi:hypothetical protein
MRNLLPWALLLTFVGFVLPLLAADDPKADLSKEPDKAVNTEKALKAGQITGKILAVIESKTSLRLQITLQIPKLNQGAVTALQQAQINYAQAAARRNVAGMLNAQRSMAQHQANLYTLATATKEVELEAIEDVKVRLANPPDLLDDQGKAKKYTAKELKELKGPDPKLPGYTGKFSDLRQNQVVAVTLVKKKEEPASASKPNGKGGGVDQALENLPQVSMVVVLSEPKANANPGK